MITDKESEIRKKIGERMGRMFIFMISHVAHMTGKKGNREINQSGYSLQLEQLPVLFTTYFSGNDLLSQQEISNLVQKDKSGIQRSIRTLERDGYLTIVADALDRRKNLIRLTPAGKMAVEKIIEIVEQLDEKITNHLTAEEIESFLKTLHKISALLEK